jgi:hypothetical protein
MKIFYISATNPVGCVLSNGVNGWDEDDMIVRRIIRNGRKNQPFDFPRSKAQGLLRVDTERRFRPHPKGRCLAPSKYQDKKSPKCF